MITKQSPSASGRANAGLARGIVNPHDEIIDTDAERLLPTPAPLPRPSNIDGTVSVLRGVLLTLVRRDGRDLTARQLTAYLTVYMDEEVHTVSSLANLLHITRPGVTRILDRLVEFDLVSREEDREDRRRVLVRRTQRGNVFFRELSAITRSVVAEMRSGE